MFLRLFSLCLATVLTPATLWADDTGPLVVTPKQPAPIRTAPPSGLLRIPGDQTGETDLAKHYVILDRIDVQTGLGASQTWVELAPIDTIDGTPEIADSGWAYFGSSSDLATSQSPNFTALASDAVAPTTRSLIIDHFEELR